MTEFRDWYNNVPLFTRVWLTLTIVMSILGRFGLLSYYTMMLDFYPFIHKFQVSLHVVFKVSYCTHLRGHSSILL